MQAIRSFLLDVEGNIFNKLFSTAPVLCNNSSSCDNTQLDEYLEHVFAEKANEFSYKETEFASFPYQLFIQTVESLGIKAFRSAPEQKPCTLEELTRAYENGQLSACEYWAIIGIIYLVVVREGSNDSIPSIQKSAKTSEAVHKVFYELASEKNWNYTINNSDLFVEKEFCQNLEDLLLRLLRKALSKIETLDGLMAVSYQHPADRMVLKRLTSLPLVGTACEKISNVLKRNMEIMFLANSQRVTPSSHPRLYKLFWTAAQILGLSTIPELYIDSSMDVLNAFTSGSDEKAFIALSPKIIYQFDERELLYVIGHEMGHIQCGHVKYHMLAKFLCYGASSIPILGPVVQGLTKLSVGPLLALWSRYSEFTCDRAGLLCCQNREAALRACVKMAGQPWDQFHSIRTRNLIDQTILFDQLTKNFGIDQFFSFQQVLFADHPFTIYRASELLKWIANGEYDELVNNDRNGRIALADRAKLDASIQNLYRYAERALIEWHLENYSTERRKPIAREIRKVLYECRQADSAPVSYLFAASLQIHKKEADLYEFHLVFNTIFNGKPTQIDAKLNVAETDRDSLPEEVRNQFLQSSSDIVEVCLFKA